MRYDIATPEVGLALAEIVADELRREHSAQPAASAADVLTRERPPSPRGRALDRALNELGAEQSSVLLPLSRDEVRDLALTHVGIVSAELKSNCQRVDEVATRRHRALQRRGEGLERLIGELRGDGPVIRRSA